MRIVCLYNTSPPVKKAKVPSQFACSQGERKFKPTKKELIAKSQRLLLQLETW